MDSTNEYSGFSDYLFCKERLVVNSGKLGESATIIDQVYMEFTRSAGVCVPSLQACNFIKKEIPTQVYTENIVKFLKKAFFIEHLWWLLLIGIFLRILRNF